MAKNKTIATEQSVMDFIDTVVDSKKKMDSIRLLALFEKQTAKVGKLWGSSIIGFGSYHYKYESGHEGDAPLVAFSPRKDALVLYLSSEFSGRQELLDKLGKHKTGKACIYIKKIDDIEIEVLEKLIAASWSYSVRKQEHHS